MASKVPAFGVTHSRGLTPLLWAALLAFVLRGRIPQVNTGLRIVLSGLALASLLLVSKYLRPDGPTSIITYAVSALASVALLVAFLQTNTRFLYRAPFRWVVYLGRISYGLYVFHLFAIALMSGLSSIPVMGIPLNFERRLLLSFLLTVILAAASYRWLEQPFLRLKKRFSYTPVREAEALNDKEVGPVGPTVGDVARAS